MRMSNTGPWAVLGLQERGQSCTTLPETFTTGRPTQAAAQLPSVQSTASRGPSQLPEGKGHPGSTASVQRSRCAPQATATPASSLESPLPFHLWRREAREGFRLHFALHLETLEQSAPVERGETSGIGAASLETTSSTQKAPFPATPEKSAKLLLVWQP